MYMHQPASNHLCVVVRTSNIIIIIIIVPCHAGPAMQGIFFSFVDPTLLALSARHLRYYFQHLVFSRRAVYRLQQ